ncbi:hypothetical protein B6S59_07585 [Pseudomonas sp. A46]|nr:hypothetical protein B6S59_07585 [Pseudomonas sp. A46]
MNNLLPDGARPVMLRRAIVGRGFIVARRLSFVGSYQESRQTQAARDGRTGRDDEARSINLSPVL